ncbi:MAG: hypothetical protein HOC71_11315 [Candidatus Latescibacteria bacterium]|jgi:hypothetical protein|nr:hypothetical protein [Candidatus Latescibacterota bacterium]
MKSFPLLCVAVIVIIVFETPLHAEPSSYLPVGHRAYDFLEQMEHKFNPGGMALKLAHMGTKPVIRSKIARLLYELEQEKEILTRVEREELGFLLDEFEADYYPMSELDWDAKRPLEIMPAFLHNLLYRNRRNMFVTFGDTYSLFLDPVIVRKAQLGTMRGSSKEDNVFTSTNGFILRGTVGDNIGFHIDVRDSKEWGSRDYPEDTSTTMAGRGYAGFKGDRAEFDETYAHLAYTKGPFVLSYGRDRNVWGRGRQGTLIMSRYGAPYDMIRLEAEFWKLNFMFFAAEIEQHPSVAKFYYRNPPGVFSDSVTVKKRISGHRIEINFSDRLSIGLHETVVYGGRWDMAYLNPLIFLKGAEHANDDHDNAAMGMDFRLFLRRNSSVYGEFFIDDITTTKLGTGWYGNKLAYQIGTFYLEPLGLKDMDFRMEYTRINPWVYTHRYSINSYTHYGDVLGFQTGPNSDEFSAELRKRFTRKFHSAFYFVRHRHGSVGGDPLQGFTAGDSKKVKFLDGTLEKTTALGINLSYEICWELFFKIGYTYEEFNGDSINIYRLSLGLNDCWRRF